MGQFTDFINKGLTKVKAGASNVKARRDYRIYLLNNISGKNIIKLMDYFRQSKTKSRDGKRIKLNTSEMKERLFYSTMTNNKIHDALIKLKIKKRVADFNSFKATRNLF